MLNLLASLCYRLSIAASCAGEVGRIVCHGIGDYFQGEEQPSQELPPISYTLEEHARFRRLIEASDPDAEREYRQCSERTLYEIRAQGERLRVAELSRSPVSRKDEGRLVEEWIPSGEVSR